MVHFLAISIFLLSIVKILGSEFWDDVDKKYDELSDPEDLPTQATINEAQQAGPSPEGPSSNNQEQTGRRRKKGFRKLVSFAVTQMKYFNQAVIIDPDYPKNLSETQIINKLLALGSFHEWPLLRKYELDYYSKYWIKVCIFFSKLNLTDIKRVSCKLTPTIGVDQKRRSQYRGTIQSYDLLGCHCHGYQINCLIPATPADTIFIHQSSANEFFVFDQDMNSGSNLLYLRNFKGGITLPNPDTYRWLNL